MEPKGGGFEKIVRWDLESEFDIVPTEQLSSVWVKCRFWVLEIDDLYVLASGYISSDGICDASSLSCLRETMVALLLSAMMCGL